MKLFAMMFALVMAAAPSDYDPPKGKELSWSAVFAVPDEGDPMIVSGAVYAADAKTPLEGVILYAYHTNSKGRYRDPEDPDSHRGVHGWMRTNAEGRFEFTSIRPAGYPGGRIEPHIHFVATAKGAPEQRFELLFEDDPAIPKPIVNRTNRGGIYLIQPIEEDKEGVWRCTVAIVLLDRSKS